MKKYRNITALIVTAVMIASVFTFGSVTATASASPVQIVEIGSDENPGYTATYDAEWEDITIGIDVPEGDLFYALKFNPSNADTANWFPVFGDTIDVSKYIPSKQGKTYVIGFILMKDLQSGEFANAKALTIPSRVAAPSKNKNKYDPKNGFTLEDGTEVRFESGGWIDKNTVDRLSGDDNESGKTANWFTTAENFPFGAKGEIRMAADVDNYKAASSSIKFKIPAQPKSPKVTLGKVGTEKLEDKQVDVIGLKGAKSTMEISLSKDFPEDEVIDAEDKMKVADLHSSKLFTGENAKVIDEDKKLTIYIRTKETEKKPYSVAAEIEVDFSIIQTESENPPAS